MYVLWRRFQRSTEGAHLVEYALLVGVVAMGAVAVLGDVAVAISNLIQPIVDSLGALLP